MERRMMVRNALRILYMAFLPSVLLVGVGCTSNQAASPALSSQIVQTTTAPSDTSTPAQLPQTTLIVTATPQRIISGSTATYITPTTTLLPPTYAPTMTELERTSAILKLLRENTGCNLPCWWGFVPGITHWRDASLLFQNMGKTPEYYKSSNYLQLDIPERSLYFGQIYYIQNDLIDFIYIGAGVSKNGHFIYGDPVFEEDFQNYLLPNILEKYGVPDEILLRTFLAAPEGGDIPFHFVLFYGKIGIMVIYTGNVIKENTSYQICPQKSDIVMYLWPPEQHLTLIDLTKKSDILTYDDILNYKELSIATGSSIDDFYRIFKEPNNKICLKTLISS